MVHRSIPNEEAPPYVAFHEDHDIRTTWYFGVR